MVDDWVGMLMIKLVSILKMRGRRSSLSTSTTRRPRGTYSYYDSATSVDNCGRTLSGQAIEGYSLTSSTPWRSRWVSVCARGATQMLLFYKLFTYRNQGWRHVYPDAGLPNAMGGYDATPGIVAADIYEYAKVVLLNFVAG